MKELLKTLGALAFAASAGGALWLLYSIPDGTERASAEAPNPCPHEAGAYLEARRAVEGMLKSPRTADFPRMSHSAVIVDNYAECEYLIRSYVDAENSFGANVRTVWTADVTHDLESRRWTADARFAD